MGDVSRLHPPRGWFHALSTRDGEALRRDGEPFYQSNELTYSREKVVEVLFGDGTWMIAAPADLEWNSHSG